MNPQRRVNRYPIDKWIDENGPDGLLKLAMTTGVSASTLAKVRLGYVPRKHATRKKICLGLICKEDLVFPLLVQRKAKAS